MLPLNPIGPRHALVNNLQLSLKSSMYKLRHSKAFSNK